jgi:DNA-binding transcriptional regulator YiaG
MLIHVRKPTEAAEYLSLEASPTAMHFDSEQLDALDLQIGRRIRLRRRQLGMNQTDLATRIGVTFQQVHKYESGQSAVTAARLFAIAAAMNCPVDYFYADVSS